MPIENSDPLTDHQAKARILAGRLIRTCRRSGADSYEIISALSVVLGTIVGNVATENPGVVDLTIETINRAVAYGAESDQHTVLQ
jgi:hypothetical protein